MSRTERKHIKIFDEGVEIIADLDSIDFAGAGVSGTAIGNAATETIPGGGSSVTPVNGEDLTPQGPGTSFTLAHTPTAGSVRIYRGGGRQQEGTAPKDYTISGANITLNVALATGEVLLADYTY